MPEIDWSRMARPQEDGYDSDIALFLGGPREAVSADQYIFGSVAVTPPPREMAPDITGALLSHPNIKAAEALINKWPAGAKSFQRLMRQFHPLEQPEQCGGWGSVCGSDESLPGTMYATIYSVEGLAEAFMHEMGHTKLRYLGVMLEHADRLITNGPDEVFVSPLRKDKLRPMSAVVHATYSYTYVTVLDLVIEAPQAIVRVNRDRIAEGRDTIKQNLKTDDEGKRFFYGYFEWLDEVIAECESYLSSSLQTAHG